jgi:signal peptidase I
MTFKPKPGAFRLLTATAAAAVLLFNARFRVVLVVGTSMEPGYRTGDVLIFRRNTNFGPGLNRGEVVAARYRGDLVIKRVVGMPGEEIGVTNGALYVNQHLWEEAYPVNRGPSEIPTGRLLEGRYALIGDNRPGPPAEVMSPIVGAEQVVGSLQWAIRWRSPSGRG